MQYKHSKREIQSNRNVRDPEMTKLKLALRELYWNPPLWSEDEISSADILEYRFDEKYRGEFMIQNCFTEAWKKEKDSTPWKVCCISEESAL